MKLANAITATSLLLLNALLRYPKLALFSILCVCIVLLGAAKQVDFDTSVVGFLDTKNPARIAYNQFKEEFGLSEYFVILAKADDVLADDFLQRLDQLQQQLQQKTLYAANIESLITVDYIHSNMDELTILPLYDVLMGKGVLRETILNHPYYQKRLINADATATAIIIELQPFVQSERTGNYQMLLIDDVLESYLSVENVIAQQQQYFNHSLYLGGSPAIAAELKRATEQDVVVFSALALMLAVLVLSIMFSHWVPVVGTLLILVVTTALIFSWMFIGRYPMQMTSAMLPAFIVAVCIGDSIHFLRSFYAQQYLFDQKVAALQAAFKQTAPAIFFTSITTAAGLFSFSYSDIVPVANFGFFSAIAVLAAMFVTIIVLPPWLLLMPVKAKAGRWQANANSAKVVKFVCFIGRYHRWIISVFIAVLCISFLLLPSLKITHDPLAWFDDDSTTVQANKAIERGVTGTVSIEVLVDTQINNGVYNPQLLQQISSWLEQLEAEQMIASHNSVLTLLQELHRLLKDTDDGSVLPQNQALLAQEILLLEVNNASKLDQYTDLHRRKLRIQLLVNWQDAIAYQALLSDIESSFKQVVTQQVSLNITGMAAVLNQTILQMVSSMTQSYLIAAVLVSLMIIIILRSLPLGLLAMLPNFIPIVVLLAFMAVVGIALDMFTLLIGSIAIGIIVDDSIHFFYSFKKFYRQHACVEKALCECISYTGFAMIMTSVVLSLSFVIYCFSYLNNLQYFGMLTALCIMLALLADLVLLPALLVLFYKNNNTFVTNDRSQTGF